MAETKSLKKNSLFSFLNAFTTLIFPLITFPYASRILHPEGIGKVNFAVSIETYFAMLAGLGIVSYATREAAKRRDNKFELSKFCKEIITINFISMVIAYGLMFAALFTVPKLEQYRVLIMVRSANIFFSTIGLEWLYRAEEDFKYITLRSLIFKFSGLAFLFIFVKTENDTVAYTIFGILTSVASNICNLIHSRKYIDYKLKCHLELKKHLKFIFIFFGMSVVTSLYNILDTSFLGFLSNDRQVGYYAAATKINRLVIGVLTAAASVLFPRLSYYIENNNIEKFNEVSEKSLSLMLLLSIPMTIGLIFLSKPFVMFFSGPDFLDAVPAMHIISPVVIAIGVGSITGAQILPSLGKEKLSLVSYAIGGVTNITINAILIPKYGAVGAAFGTLVAEYAVTITQLIFLRRFVTKTLLKNLLQSILCCIPMTGLLIVISLFIKNSVLCFLISGITGVLCYALALFLIKNSLFMEFANSFINKFKKKKVEE